jgi:hypothetical protein
MEELQKQVNEYRRREQQQDSLNCQDGGVGQTKGDTIHVNTSDEKTVFLTECVIDTRADIKSLPSISSNTLPPNNISPGNLSSNNTIKSKDSPVDVEKEKEFSRNSNGYSMGIDRREDAFSLIGSIAPEHSTKNAAIQQTHAVVQPPQRDPQPQHQRAHIPQQFPFTAFSLAAPALPPAYNLATDWGWMNTPNLYRDPMNHQTISGMESQNLDCPLIYIMLANNGYFYPDIN